MNLQFSKMHGLGNEYLYINCMEQKLKHPEDAAREIKRQHPDLGANGLVIIGPSSQADFEIRMFNMDGTEDRMCNSGIRCAGKYVYDHHLTTRTDLTIETKGGVKRLWLTAAEGLVTHVRAEMGKASLRAKDIPVETDYDDYISQPMMVDGEVYLVTCVSVGSAHAVIFCDEIETFPVDRVGPLFEQHELFPEGINVEFAELVDRRTLKLRSWRRSGKEDCACGTGACAAVVAAVENAHLDYEDEITVRMEEGKLRVIYSEDGTLTMRSRVTHVCDGIAEIEE